jgi:hypothetical protein
MGGRTRAMGRLPSLGARHIIMVGGSENLKRINPIEVSLTCGVLLAVMTLFFPAILPAAVFWPEKIVVHVLGKIFAPHDQENIVIWLPVHFLYFGFVGWLLGFTCTWMCRRLYRA